MHRYKFKNFFFVLENYKFNFFVAQIKFKKKIYQKKNLKIYKKLIKWVLLKIFDFFYINSILILHLYPRKNRYILKKKNQNYFFLKFQFLLYFFYINLFKKFKYWKIRCFNTNSRRKSNKNLVLWEFINKMNKIFSTKFFFLPLYEEKIIEINQILENSKFFFKKNYLLNPSFCFKQTVFEVKNFFINCHIYNEVEFFQFFLFFHLVQNFLCVFFKIFFQPIKKKNSQKIINFSINFMLFDIFIFLKKFVVFDFFIKKKIKEKKNLKISLSYKHGLGLFSLFLLKKMSILLEYRGEPIEFNNLKKSEQNYRSNGKNIFFFKLNQIFTIDATLKGNFGRLINHSCLPNCYPKLISHGFFAHIIIISLKRINFLEEISYDYRINPDEMDHEELKCSCEMVTCRKNLYL
jgi:hypothetical protein